MTSTLAALAIDGSVLEGGGQLLRNSVALSALLGRPISIHKVRHNRKPPGLKSQHAAGIKLAAEISSASLIGATNGSSVVEFSPTGLVKQGAYTADPGTAGSTTLLLQIALPCLLFADNPTHTPSTLLLRGGTNASQAPQIDYTRHVLLPFLRHHFSLSPRLAIDIRTRGYFPRGGGSVHCTIPPVRGPLPAITLVERGAIRCIRGEAHVAGLPARLAYKMGTAATARLHSAGLCDPTSVMINTYRVRDDEAVGAGAGITLWAESESGCIIGGSALSSRREQDLADVGEQAAAELMRNLQHGGCVDEYLQDQIIILLALADGPSTVRTGPLTLHTRTAIWVAQQLTDAIFEIEENVGGSEQCIIRCRGIGYHARTAEGAFF